MDPLSRFDSAFGGPETGLGLRALCLHLWLSGRLGLHEIRRSRLLASTERGRLLLLLLSVPYRAGAPRARSSALEDLLACRDPWISAPEGCDPARERAVLEGRVPGLRSAWADLVAQARRNPSEIAEWCGRPEAPGVLVEFEELPDPEWSFQRPAAAERILEEALLARIRAPLRPASPDEERAILRRILSEVPLGTPHRLQARAAALSLRAPFLVVSGGPGTGKTTVVVQILRALRRLLELDPRDIALCAPTGRAQARLVESVRASLSRLGPSPETAADLALAECAGGTLHSLLGARGDGTFRHGPGSPLPFRLVVVDESSMVDLRLFSALVSALPEECALVLVGDRNQLPSVEAGAVLSDLVGVPEGDPLSPEGEAWTESVLVGIGVEDPAPPRPRPHPLADRLVLLERSYRSVPEIGSIAERILRGDRSWIGELPAAAASEARPGVSRLPGRASEWLDEWVEALARGFEAWTESGRPDPGVAALLESRRVLCAVHGGDSGREALCRGIDLRLRSRWRARTAGHFPGRQVLVPRNRPDLGLRNGDIGLVALVDGAPRVGFPQGGAARWLDPSLVPELEPAWAMTVHKAQGSEFDEVVLSLPDFDTPLLDRPIAYTALTRARGVLRISGNLDLLARACARIPDRPSRLRRTLFP